MASLLAVVVVVGFPPEPASRFRDAARRAVGLFLGYRRLPGAAGRWGDAAVRRSELEQSRLDGEAVRADHATMVAIAAGDRAAFARVVGEVSPALLRFARAMLASGAADAEEIVQEALIRLWRQAGSWRPEGRITTWLHQVVHHLAIDHLRRRRPAIDIDDAGLDLVDATPLPGTRLALREDVRAVQAAVAALPGRQRVAIVLCHYQGLSQAEAAAIMGIGEDAYESLLARGRRSLRAALGNGRDRT